MKSNRHISAFEWVNNLIESNNQLNYFLNESQGSKSISQAIDLAMERAKTSKDEWISSLTNSSAFFLSLKEDINSSFDLLALSIVKAIACDIDFDP